MVAIKNRWYILSATILITIVLLLPTLISTTPSLKLFQSVINKKITGKLTVESFSIGWLQGFACKNIVYRDSNDTFTLNIPEITGENSFLDLAINPRHFGVITINYPVLGISVKSEGSPKSQTGSRNQTVQQPESSAPAGSGQEKTPFWNKIILQAHVKNGRITALIDSTAPTDLFQNINLESELSRGTINYNLNLQSGDSQGAAQLKGFINLPASFETLKDTIVSQSEIKISKIQTKNLLALIKKKYQVQINEGIMDASFKLGTVGIQDANITGEINLSSLVLDKIDQDEENPKFGNINLIIDNGKIMGENWKIKQFNMKSDFGQIMASGHYIDEEMELRGQGNIKLDILYRQFPFLFKKKTETSILSGTVHFLASLSHNKEKTGLTGQVIMKNFSGTFEDQSFEWDEVMLDVDGLKTASNILVNKLVLKAPFISAEGKGDLEEFECTGSADLLHASSELNKIFPLQWSGSGTLNFQATSRKVENDVYTMTASVTGEDFAIAKLDTTILPPHPITLKGRLSAPLSFFTQKKGNGDLLLGLSSVLGDISIRTENLNLESGSISTKYSLNSQVNLNNLSLALDGLNLLPENTQMSGTLSLRSNGMLSENRLSFDSLDAQIKEISFIQPDFTFFDNELTLKTLSSDDTSYSTIAVKPIVKYDALNYIPMKTIQDSTSKTENPNQQTEKNHSEIDFTHNFIALHDLVLASSAVTVQLNDLVLLDIMRPLNSIKTDVVLDLDLEKLATLLRNNRKIAKNLTITGSGFSTIKAEIDTPANFQRYDVDMQIKQLEIWNSKKKIVDNEKLHLDIKADTEPVTNNLNFNDISLQSKPLSLTATGMLPLKNEQHNGVVHLQGEIKPDLEEITDLLNTLTQKQIILKGNKSQKFELFYPLDEVSGKARTKQIKINTSLAADSVDIEGIQAQSLNIPFTMENGILNLNINGLLNKGKLDVKQRISFIDEPFVLTTKPQKQLILKSVQLTDSLNNFLLSKIHPLFGLLTEVDGQIDMSLDSMHWELEKDGYKNAKFSTVIDLKEISLQSTTLLKTILKSFRLDDEELQLEDKQISCTAEEGRISCAPIKIILAGSPMTISGSIGMDQTLDYKLEIPITKKLTGVSEINSLENTTVTIPLGGNLDKAHYDINALTKALASVLSKATIKAVSEHGEKELKELIKKRLKLPENN